MNTDGTNFQNGLFVNVDEEHNNTKNMTLSGFNQVGGKVTGNIQNLTIESKQNTSTTTGSTKGGSIGFAPNGMPNLISANYSQTNGERKYVDDPTTFIIGDGSNLKVGKVENTASAIGTTGNGKLSIDEYIGHNLENKDKTTTKGASLSLSPSSTPVSGVGVNYANRDLESVTKNTVVGNVEIGKSSGDEINKDLASMTEITKDKDTKTDIFVESQTIRYAVNPESFKEDLQKAKNEIHDIYHAVDSTVNPQGKESRNILQQLAETRQAKTILNVVGSRLEIAKNQEDIAKAFEGVSEDLGYKVKVIYTDPSNSPQLIGVDKNGNTYIKNGTAYVDKKTGIGYILINTESSANRTKSRVIGTIAEEQSHVIGKIEGRQKVVPDGSEKGLESLGRPTNDYFKNEFSKNDKAIGIVSDGKDYSNVDFGENVGDSPMAAPLFSNPVTAAITGIVVVIGYTFAPQETKDKINQAVINSYEKIKNGLSKLFGMEDEKEVTITIIRNELLEQGIIADVTIDENTGKININEILSSKNSNGKKEEQEPQKRDDKKENINKNDKGSKEDKNNKEPNNDEQKKQPSKKSEDDSEIDSKTIGTMGGAAYAINSGVRNSSNKSTTNKASEKTSNITNTNSQQKEVAQNNANKPKTEVSNPDNQQVRKEVTSNNQQGTPVSKTPDINKPEVSQKVTDVTQKAVSTISDNKKVGDLTFYAEEDGYEVYYRTMSLENYENFKKTGKIPPTGETTISPTQAFSEGYDGVLIKFKVKKGTTEKLMDIGVRDESSTLADEFSNMPKSTNGWGKNHAQFKKEKEQLNIGLGKGKALDIFNENIVETEVINMNNKKEVNKK